MVFLQHISDIGWCSIAVTVVAQTDYFVSASFFDSRPMNVTLNVVFLRRHLFALDDSSCIALYALQVACHIMSRTKQQRATVVNS